MLPWKSAEQAPRTSTPPWGPTVSTAGDCTVPLSSTAQLDMTLAQFNTHPTMKHDVYLIIMFRKACTCARGGLWKQRKSAIVIIISFHIWGVLRKRYGTGGMAAFIPGPESKQPLPFLRCQKTETSLALPFKYCYSEGAFIVWPGKKSHLKTEKVSSNLFFFLKLRS